MKKAKTLSVLLILTATLMHCSMFKKDRVAKCGIVDTGKILARVEQSSDVFKELVKENKKIEKEYVKKSEELIQAEVKLKNQKFKNKQQMDEIQLEILKIKQERMALMPDLQARYDKRRKTLMFEMFDRLDKKIKAYAKKHDFDVVYDANTSVLYQAGSEVVCPAKYIHITDKIISKMDGFW